MNNETLERHFDLAFSAPSGVQKLRELILTFAMQGKLVSQDPNDQPASELLERIETEKRSLMKEGKIKKPKPLPEIGLDETPYDLPESWEWTRLGKIGEINPRNIADADNEVGFVPMPLISSEYSGNHKFETRNWSEIKKGYTHFADGDVGLAKITPCFENAKSCVFDGLPSGIGAGTTELHIFRNTFSAIDPRYLLAYLKNPRYISSGKLIMTGSAGQKRVPTDFFTSNPFPLPPLAEQKRIVAKIDRLMAQCDELENLGSDRNQKRIMIHTAAINRLLAAQENSDFSTARDFLQQHFGELYSVKENVAELRKAILQLAVMGKLMPQDPEDEPASELLRAIELEKRRLVREGKIKQANLLSEVAPKDISSKLPSGWNLVRFSELTIEIATGPFGSMIHKSDYVENGVPLVNPIHMVKGEIIHDPTVTVTLDMAAQMKSYRLLEGDIVMARRGEMGRCAVVTRRSHGWLCGTGSFVLRLPSNIDRQYIALLFQSQGVRDYLAGSSVGTTMTNLNHGILSKMPVMLPPLAEQYRIVAKINQLMDLCDELEKQIDAATDKRTELLNALMAQV
jgi:type I restriction enzyme, S subunit